MTSVNVTSCYPIFASQDKKKPKKVSRWDSVLRSLKFHFSLVQIWIVGRKYDILRKRMWQEYLCHQIFLMLTFPVSHCLLSAVFHGALIMPQKADFVLKPCFREGKTFIIKTNSRGCACVARIVSYTRL